MGTSSAFPPPILAISWFVKPDGGSFQKTGKALKHGLKDARESGFAFLQNAKCRKGGKRIPGWVEFGSFVWGQGKGV